MRDRHDQYLKIGDEVLFIVNYDELVRGTIKEFSPGDRVAVFWRDLIWWRFSDNVAKVSL